MLPAKLTDQLSQLNLNRGFEFNVGNLTVSPTYLEAGAIIFLIFVLILTLAQVRRHFLDWSFKGAFFGLFFGFVLALILEGFLVLSGRTAVTEILGWKNAPKPIANVLDAGRARLVKVLGAQAEVTATYAQNYSADEMVKIFQSLNPAEASRFRSLICNP
jgi:phosphoglycerol transferase MdoB-like AlkP superfamily enzyme